MIGGKISSPSSNGSHVDIIISFVSDSLNDQMVITKLILKNVKCFDHIVVPFLAGDGSLIDTTLLKGVNSTGKTTILRSIALVLSGSAAIGEIKGKIDSWIKKGKDSCQIIAHLKDAKGKVQIITLEIKIGMSVTRLILHNRESLSQLDRAIEDNQNCLVIAYGAHRRPGISGPQMSAQFKNIRAESVGTLFHNDAALHSLNKFLMDLDYRAKGNSTLAVKKAFKVILPDVQFERIDKKNMSLLFSGDDGVVEFDVLSESVQVVANLIGDLLYRITTIYENFSDPLDAQFILLIDEIDLFLHPEWQRTIAKSLRKVFKKAQIVITSNSPFVEEGLKKNEVLHIRRDKNKDLEIIATGREGEVMTQPVVKV